jgi:hypothetical protein
MGGPGVSVEGSGVGVGVAVGNEVAVAVSGGAVKVVVGTERSPIWPAEQAERNTPASRKITILCLRSIVRFYIR